MAGDAAGRPRILRTRVRPSVPRGLLGRGERGLSRLQAVWEQGLTVPSAAVAPSAAVRPAQDAASGLAQPVGGRTPARREEDRAVGCCRAPRPQGGRLAGGLLQRLPGAGGWRKRGAAGSLATVRESGANAGPRSEGGAGWRLRVARAWGARAPPAWGALVRGSSATAAHTHRASVSGTGLGSQGLRHP